MSTKQNDLHAEQQREAEEEKKIWSQGKTPKELFGDKLSPVMGKGFSKYAKQREGIEEMRAQRIYKDFEDFLQEKFIESNPTVLDDDIPDAFDDWLVGLDVDTLIAYANSYGLSKQIESVDRALKTIKGE